MSNLGNVNTLAASFNESHPRKDGHYHLGNRGLSSWRVQKPHKFTKAPVKGGVIVTAEQLIRDRVEVMDRILKEGGIDFQKESSNTVQGTILKYAQDIIQEIATDGHEWHTIGNTSTMIMVDKRGHAHVVNAPQERFRDPNFIDYSALGPNTDGGALINTRSIEGEETGVISGKIFRNINKSGGGNKTLDKLMKHPFIVAMIPDERLRNDYLFSLGVLDKLQPSDNGTQSLWIPHDLPPWMMRWIALGVKANAFYPPNLKTTGFDVLMRGTSK
ncbi:hypothetical protein KA057_00375 [Candidatus Gracilibacteria bacterium]|nr:hypothetical protein [Candidatus Gracilibacteria bacterium]